MSFNSLVSSFLHSDTFPTVMVVLVLSIGCVTCAFLTALFLVKNVQTVKAKPWNLLAGPLSLFFFYFFNYIRLTLSLESFIAFFLFYFTLTVTIFTDYYTYLISTLMTLYLVPVAFFYAHQGYLDITLFNSVATCLAMGTLMHYVNLYYHKRKGHAAFGEGDRDLIMYIGAFLGFFSIAPVIFYASLIGSVWGVSSWLLSKHTSSFNNTIVPFGTCLGLGVLIHSLLRFTYGISYIKDYLTFA